MVWLSLRRDKMFGVKRPNPVNPIIIECGHEENDVLQDAQANLCFAGQWAKKVDADAFRSLTVYRRCFSKSVPECSEKVTRKMLFGELASIEEYLASVPAEILKKFDLDAK